MHCSMNGAQHQTAMRPLQTDCSLSDLPYMINRQILSYLDLRHMLRVVAPLNRYFYNLTRDRYFWRRLDFTKSSCRLTLAYLRQLLDFAPGAHTITLSRQSCEDAEITDDVADIIGEVLDKCPKLVYLQMAYLRPSLDVLTRFCNRRTSSSSPAVHPHLRHLDLSGSDQLTPQLVESLAISFPNLESLCIAHCRRACNATTGRLGNLLPRLAYINLDENTMPPAALTELLLSRSDTLERLVLDASGCEDNHLAMALAKCTRLKMLNCDFAEDVGNDLLVVGVSRLVNLESLTLRKAYRIDDETIQQVGGAVHFAHLSHLDLTECRSLTDIGFEAFISKSGHNLEIMVLNWCWKLTDDSMDVLLNTCRQLRSLSLVGLHQLTGRQLPSVPSCLPGLLFMDLRTCNAVQDQLCHQLVVAMPQLCIVDFFGFIVDGSGCDSGKASLSPESAAAGFAFTERWTRPLRMLRM